ncbi:DUF3604 domain-containing protein [Pyruvatibacter sp. HU-CL02332]|uniref:DUF3604 domain-containing protein n=1 Tax=Pyruvatibacter sp. HU-CL02332 TaxID=3127650 RepID=UPI00310A4BDB
MATFDLRILVASGAALALAACGDAGNDTTADATAPEPAEVTEVAAAEPIAPEAESATPVAAASADTMATDVFWGDTHLHTSDSADAFAFGARLGPEAALKFASGEKVTSTTGTEAQLSRPLDFLVIADHAEGLGVTREIYNGNPALMTDERLARWSKMLQAGGKESAQATLELIDGHTKGTNPEVLGDPKVMGPILKNLWQARGDLIEQYNEPGTFSAFVGYEYTSVPKGDNMHRVVVYRDGPEITNNVFPFSSTVSEDPADLWTVLEQYEANTGGQVLAIPHNSNLSNGRMFALVDFEGAAIDAEYATRRARWEPIVEVTQIKGDSESHPFLSPNDEFASYGDAGWEDGNLNIVGNKTPEMLSGDYVREALKRGLSIEKDTGVNPFKFGMIGSTDSHTALATADSDNFFGKHTGVEPGKRRANKTDGGGSSDGIRRLGWQYLASGYAAVWAKENTREALFDAMMRKEVYASTGPRIKLRFFGGCDFVAEDAEASDFATRGYAKGVPMGGDVAACADGAAPSFLVHSVMDPDGANLDRVQIIKGWVDANGETQEQVHDVVWSDDRVRDADGKIPDVGNTVDLSGPSWTNTIGAAQLATVWTDPDFDPTQRAFYYVRTIEIPTPRWTAYDVVRYGTELPEGAELINQERAYSSPIWYDPA